MISRDGGFGQVDANSRDLAIDALLRGCASLTEHAGEQWIAAPWGEGRAGTVRSKVLSNWLRELDSLLCAILDGRASDQAVARTATPQNRAACWCRPSVGVRLDGATRKRLLALRRSQLTLSRYGGFVRQLDRPGESWLTAGWSVPGSGTLRRFEVGARLELNGADLTDICRFYERLASSLAAAPANRGHKGDSLSVGAEIVVPFGIAPTAPSRARLRAV